MSKGWREIFQKQLQSVESTETSQLKILVNWKSNRLKNTSSLSRFWALF